MKSLTKGFGIAGMILIIFGIIALAITKLMNWYVYSHLGLGVLLIILYSIFNFETFMERLRERSTTEGGKVFIYAGVVVLIIVLLNVIAFRKSHRWDVTSSKVFSLEDQSLKILQQMPSSVHVTAFMEPKNAALEPFKGLSAAYQYNSKKFQFDVVDPDKKPDMANRYQVKDGDIRFEYGSENKTLSSYDEKALKEALKERIKKIYYFGAGPDESTYKQLTALTATPEFKEKGVSVELVNPLTPPPPGVEAKNPAKGDIYIEFYRKDTVIREVSEQAFTNALIQITRQVTPTVRFTSGHGERDLESEEENGFSVIKGAIQNEGYDVKSMSGGLVQGVPAGTDILIIAGPLSPFTKEEADSVDKYLENGGKLILLAEPNFSNPKLSSTVNVLDTGLEAFAEKWGVTLGKNIVLEKHLQLLAGQVTEPMVVSQSYGEHEITKPLAGRSTVFHVARSVRKGAKAGNEMRVTELIMSAAGSSNSWAEVNLTKLIMQQQAEYDTGADYSGPVPVAAVVERQKGAITSKLAIFGDADFVNNRFVRSQEFNYDLFLNTLNWMWGRQEQISIRPKQLRSSKLLMTPEQTNIIFYTAVLTLPELVLIAGLAIYWRRRSR